MQASFVSVALNLILNLLFIGPLRFLGLGHMGLALATSVTAVANMIQLTWYLRRRVGPLEGRRMLNTLWRVSVAAAFASLLCALALRLAGPRLPGGWGGAALEVVGGLLLALVIGWGAMRALKVEELGTVMSLAAGLKRRLGGA